MIASAFLGDHNYVFWPTDAVPRVLILGAATHAPLLGGGILIGKLRLRAFKRRKTRRNPILSDGVNGRRKNAPNFVF